jgi:hypothetical protein
MTILEGSVPPGRTVLLEFPDLDSAHQGCDRSVPNPLCHQSPMLSGFARFKLNDGHGF